MEDIKDIIDRKGVEEAFCEGLVWEEAAVETWGGICPRLLPAFIIAGGFAVQWYIFVTLAPG